MTVQSEVVGPPVAPEKQNVLPVRRWLSAILVSSLDANPRERHRKGQRTGVTADVVALPLVEV